MAQQIVAGNWKMNLSLDEAKKLLTDLANKSKDIKDVQLIVCPSYVYLQEAVQILKNSNILVGAQDCSSELNGAFTGEVSATMLKEIGVNYVILGHSERRAYHGEKETLLSQKVNQAISNGLKVIYCCGETLAQREDEDYLKIIEQQIVSALQGLEESQWKDIVIAYEPVWAIGTGKTASPEQAQEVHAHIRKVLQEKFSELISKNTSILYGGSCKPSNANELFSKADVDGGLIGGASLKADDFLAIANGYN